MKLGLEMPMNGFTQQWTGCRYDTSESSFGSASEWCRGSHECRMFMSSSLTLF